VTAAAVSDDSRYLGLNADDVAVINLDGEKPTVAINASDALASEIGPDNAAFTVSRSGGTPSPLTVYYTLGGTAENGVDYLSLSGAVIVEAGSSDAAVVLTPLMDGFFEASETVSLTLSADDSYLVGVASATASISDGTAHGVIVSPTSGLITTEQGDSDTFTVVLTSQPTLAVTVNFASDTPTEGVTLVDAVTFTSSDWDEPRTVTVVGQNDDGVGDALYTIITTIASSDAGYSGLNPDDVSVTNRDDDLLPLVTVVTPSNFLRSNRFLIDVTNVDENFSSSTHGVFRISRTGSTAASLTVNYTVSGSATNGVDYLSLSSDLGTSLSGSVTIAAGKAWADVYLYPTEDIDPEGKETVVMTLSNSATYLVGSPRADVVTIRDSGASTPVAVNFGPDQIVAEGAMITVPVVRHKAEDNDSITVTYTVSGSATNPDDHNAVAGSITIPWPQSSANISFNTVLDVVPETNETVVFTIQTISSAGYLGEKSTHTVTITEENIAPMTTLVATQGAGQTHLVVASNGLVTLTATVVDPNVADNHGYDWGLTNNSLVDDNLDADPASFVFDPSALAAGFYKVKVIVTDDGTIPLAVTNELLLEVVATEPVLGSEDSDGDYYTDAIESYDDSDGDGIPDYLDVSSPNVVGRNLALNELQQLPQHHKSYVMRTEPGLTLRLGDIAFVAGSDSALVSADEIVNFGNGEGGMATAMEKDTIPNVGGYFDFEITNLPVAGMSASVVIPQFDALPEGARYRKYHPVSGWGDFVEDGKNSLASAAGIPGICPLPGDAAYTAGLTVGDLCVQLTIEDGGPNDTDGTVNYVIEDPGQVGAVKQAAVVTTDSNDKQEASNNSGGGIFNMIMLLTFFLWVTLRQTRQRT